MTDKRTTPKAEAGPMEKDVAGRTTGDEPMTESQRSSLRTLCEQARQPLDENLSRAGASRRIEELQAKAGRGEPAADSQQTVNVQEEGRSTAAVETIVSR